MNRFLQTLNLLGVVALAGLCVVQWRANRRLNLDLIQAGRVRVEQAAQLVEQTAAVAGQAGDLTELRGHLSRVTGELDRADRQLALAREELERTTTAHRALQATASNWTDALTLRDRRLEEATAQLGALADERNEAVRQFNELAERHNRLVAAWNELQTRLAGPTHTNSLPTSRPGGIPGKP